MRFPIALSLAVVLLGFNACAQAQVVYSATDSGVGPGGPHPLSDAAASAFDTAAGALGSEGLITFESAPLGNFSSLTPAPGVTVTGADHLGNPLYINNTPNNPPGPALDGFNITPGGANYLEMLGGTATFTFSSPIQTFGAYFTGIQPGFFQDTITFNDGTSQSVNVPAADAFSGGVSFAGFTDAGKSITSVTITASNSSGWDFIGIDDIRFGPAAAVPEPGSIALLLVSGLGGAGLLMKRRRR